MSEMAAEFDRRTFDRVRYHYEVEQELADRLRHSSKADRVSGLYGEVYRELFARVEDHPQHPKRQSSSREKEVGLSTSILRPWLKPDTCLLEIGAGDAALSIALAARIRRSIALDVADLVGESAKSTPRFELYLTDGIHIPLEDECVDVAYSNQLIEHLHPDDAREQLQEIRRVLKPGGVYICATPSGLNGPHDISGSFSNTPRGFHLKEYTYGELSTIMRDIGFRKTRAIVNLGGKQYLFLTPLFIMRLVEGLARLTGKKFARSRLMRALLRVQIIATK